MVSSMITSSMNYAEYDLASTAIYYKNLNSQYISRATTDEYTNCTTYISNQTFYEPLYVRDIYDFTTVADGNGYGTLITDGYCTSTAGRYWSPPSPAEVAAYRVAHMRDIIASRMAPRMVTRQFVKPTNDVTESRARETLRRCLGDQKFKQFLKNGFVTVRAASGKLYKIFPGHEMTIVYENGQPVEKLCVVLKGEYPPTDSLIMRFLLLLNNEQMFRDKANKFDTRTAPQSVVDTRTLPEIMASLKLVA